MTSKARDLQDLLRAHVPHDAEEAEHLRRMLALVEARGSTGEPGVEARGVVGVAGDLVQSDPFSRSHFEPGHFTASAFVLSPDATSLLLILHGKLHRWLQPGGHVEPEDETMLAAARREVREEVGLGDVALHSAGIFDVDVHEIPAMKGDPSHGHFDVRFLFRAPDLQFRAASDAKAARWVPLREIDAEISDRSVMRAVDKLRSR